MSSKQEDTIIVLNSLVKIKLAPSSIEGVGVFAMRDIPKGIKLYAAMFPQAYKIPFGSMKKLFPEVREYILGRWPQIVNGSAFMWPDTNFVAYCNHSDDPNYDAKTDTTLKDIKGGEEITENYKDIEGWERVYNWLLDNKK